MSVDWVQVFSVVLTGLVVVFLALVILIFAVKVCSVVVQKIEKFFTHKYGADVEKKQLGNKKEVTPYECNKLNPCIEDGIDEETVAAITVAIGMMSRSDGVTYKIKGIKRKKTAGMSVWGKTGILENTRAF